MNLTARISEILLFVKFQSSKCTCAYICYTRTNVCCTSTYIYIVQEGFYVVQVRIYAVQVSTYMYVVLVFANTQ